ncbi:ABC transporter substrate-binding protein [Streptomyces sp. NPDC051985]|uniref:ABC transporter substrate-binding protein n=1 Tax=Streptomyces sp. NPDC051985 TaxID=3155807 RepID=UPI0034217DA0
MQASRRLLCAAAAVAALLVGCSGQAPAGESGQGSAAPFVVGVMGSFTGATASVTGGVPDVMRAWKQTVNAAGGIDGHPVDLVVKDIGDAAGAGLRASRELITRDKVSAILELDANDYQWVKTASRSGVPVIATGAYGALVSPDVFPVNGSALALAYGEVAEAKAFGPKLATGIAAEITASAQQVDLMKTFGKNLGVTLAVASTLSSSAPDYTAFCQQMKQAGVSAYTLGLGAAVVEKITRQCYGQGVRIPQIIAAPKRSWRSDPAFEGDVVISQFAPSFDTSLPGVAAYRKALRTYAPAVLGSSYEVVGLNMWAAGKMFEVGAKAATRATAQDVMRGLRTVKGETLEGLTAPVTYTAGRTTSIPCWFSWKIKDGKFVLGPGGATAKCAPAQVIEPVERSFAAKLSG